MESQIAEYIEQEKLYKQKYAWHDLRKDKNDLPTEDGWYDCWIRLIDKDGEVYVDYGMDLYYYTKSKKFIDNRRQDVFDIYDVMAFEPDAKVPFDKKKIYKDICCDRTDGVIAWKEKEIFEG